ncbi:hypothetical protein V6Z12_D05G421600 [Gossypium hirsutum]
MSRKICDWFLQSDGRGIETILSFSIFRCL